MYFNQKAISNVQNSLSNRYNGNDSFGTFNDSFNLKVKRGFFSDRWYLFIAFPYMEKLSILTK